MTHDDSKAPSRTFFDRVGPRSATAIGVSAAVVAILAGYLLLNNLTRLGIWDPHELTLADLGCRRAAASGKLDVASCGGDATLKASDARPMMMVQSVAWGFRLLGISELAGRLPLALWALAGVLATVVAVGRLVDARAGLFAGLVAATTPMYLVQGRLMLGDAATMGAFAIALAGASVALFDRADDGTPTEWRARLPWAALGAVGIAAGVGSRGLAIACSPAIAVGLAWLVREINLEQHPRAGLSAGVAVAVVVAAAALGVRLALGELDQTHFRPATIQWLPIAAVLGGGAVALLPDLGAKGANGRETTTGERAERALAGAALAVGALGVAEGVAVALMTTSASDGHFIAAVGATATSTRKFPTFDLLVRQIAHGAFPWGCFVPFALGRALAEPAVDARGASRREVDLRVAALVSAAVVFGVQTMIAPRFGILPFAAPVALAIIVASVLRDLERIPAGSLAIAIGTAVLVALVINDFNFEDLAKSPVDLATAPILEPYGVYGVAAPDELRLRLRVALAIAGGVFLLPIFFVWVDESPRRGWTPPSAILRPVRVLIEAWRHPYYGLLLLLAGSFEVCIAIAGFVTYKRSIRRHIPQLQGLSMQQRDIVVNLWWLILVAAVAALVAYALFLYGRDLFRAAGRQRVATIAVGGFVAAAVWSWGVMPAVANQFSPKGVFATYRRVGTGAPIALLGVSSRTAAFELASSPPKVTSDPRGAYEWLAAKDSPRKYLAFRAENLPELNHLYRDKSDPRENLPVLDGRSAQVLLAASRLLPGERNENPLERMVLSAPPTSTTKCADAVAPVCAPVHPLECDIDGKLQCVGWDLLDPAGKALPYVTSGQRVKLRLLYRVTSHVSGGWQIFVHVEQPGTATARRTVDHVPLGSKYPMDDWLPGDVIVDESDFNLEPNMRSGPPITLLTGFFTGTTRMPLLSGPDAGPETEGLRLVLGSVPVR